MLEHSLSILCLRIWINFLVLTRNNVARNISCVCVEMSNTVILFSGLQMENPFQQCRWRIKSWVITGFFFNFREQYPNVGGGGMKEETAKTHSRASTRLYSNRAITAENNTISGLLAAGWLTGIGTDCLTCRNYANGWGQDHSRRPTVTRTTAVDTVTPSPHVAFTRSNYNSLQFSHRIILIHDNDTITHIHTTCHKEALVTWGVHQNFIL
jgi:hypothetical protein